MKNPRSKSSKYQGHFTSDREADESLVRAWWCNDYSLLAKRIRERTADARELDFVARILESGRMKKRQGTAFSSYEKFLRNCTIYDRINELLGEGRGPTYALFTAVHEFKLSKTRVNDIYEQMSGAIREYDQNIDDAARACGTGHSPYEDFVPICRPNQAYINDYVDGIEEREIEQQADMYSDQIKDLGLFRSDKS
jgi:hypothetical protein